jgi:hypothetical protein
MPKKACCCNKCSWCDRDHWTFDPYERFDPVTGEGILIQNTQPNWNTLGTITTELPSVGHPMIGWIFDSEQDLTERSIPIPNTDSAIISENPACIFIPECIYVSQFRTPSESMFKDPRLWGSAAHYGEITPCWFNGINMTNIDVFSSSRGTSGASGISGCCSAVGCCGASGYIGIDACCGPTGVCCYTGLSGASGSTASDDNHFFNFTFELKVEKLTGSVSGQSGPSGGTYSTIIDIKRTGPGKNVRPHPDACRSFNANEYGWSDLADCHAFERVDSDGLIVPCERDFARMPRGPWPYKFKDFEIPDCKNPACWEENFVGFTADVDNKLFRTADVRAALKDPTGPIASEYPWILDCPFKAVPCGGIDPGDFGGDVSSYCGEYTSLDESDGAPAACCPLAFLGNDLLCDRLDPYNGTPFGWEDCPAECSSYSNYSIPDPVTGEVNTENLKFFGWISPFNRYTTPEWDFYEGSVGVTGATSCGCVGTGYTCGPSGFCGACGFSGSTSGITSGIIKKISLHVIVPSQYDPGESLTSNGFCEPSPETISGKSFGEWCFGMDYEATDEIDILQSAGYVWSNGREDDGIWINRTPTSALRVLFTLDHSDLAPGKVWRVFRDWDVIVCNRIKTFNKGTPQEATFKITIKQKVEEVQFSSMGCDCPSGYFINECGKIESIEDACDSHQIVDGDIVYPNESPWAECWGSNIDGPTSKNIGGRVSFAERGPITIKAIVETDETGCLNCRDPNIKPVSCSEKRGSRAHPLAGQEENNEGGQIFVVNTRDLTCGGDGCPISYINVVNWDWNNPTPYLTNSYRETGAGNVGLLLSCTPISWNGTTDVLPPDYIFDLFTEHGPRWAGALADIPHSSGNRSVGAIRYRDGYRALRQSSEEEEITYGGKDKINWRLYDRLYGDSECRGSVCASDSIARNVYDYARIFIDQHPGLSPVGNCTISCSCQSDGTDGGGAGDPDTGTGDSEWQCPDGSNPPCIDVGWSGPPPEGGGSKCPCLTDPPLPSQAGHGPYVFPYYACNTNLARVNGRGANDYGLYTCVPAIPADTMDLFCQELIDAGGAKFGIDSERFYFTAFATVATSTGIGLLGCAKTCQCVGDPGTACRNEDGSCKFCEGAGGQIGIGFPRNMFINWKKYLCKKRAQQGFKIPPDIMQKFEWKCSSDDAPDTGLCGANEGLTGLGCSTAWSISDCLASNIPINNLAYTIEDLEAATDLSPQYRIVFKKYSYNEDETIEDPRMCEWDTTYEPNFARSGLTYGRNHIIINAQGPY